MSTVFSIRLPAIQHPSSRLGDPDLISLRGYSTDCRDQRCWIPQKGARARSPDTESLDSAFRSQSSRSDISSVVEKGKRGLDVPELIPEGEEDIHDKAKLPAFRHRAASENRSISRASLSTYSSIGPWKTDQTDQLEVELKEHIQTTGALALKILFKNNHPDGKPLANRSVLLEILTNFLRRPVTAKQIKNLLFRLHLYDRVLISFEEFYGALKDPDSNKSNPAGPLTIPQTLALLRGPARSRFLESVENLCKSDNRTEGWISAPEFRNVLNKLKLHLKDTDFDKLWKRLDTDGLGAVKQTIFLKELGLIKRNEPKNDNNYHTSNTFKAEDTKAPGRTLPKAEEERHTSIAIETWLKDRFRDGAQRMKAEFDKLDPESTGKVRGADFLQVLGKFDLHLKREQLGLFLSRCGLKIKKGCVQYLNFLRTFQDRSSDGITHKIIYNPKHRFHSVENVSCASSLSAIEAKLIRLFQSEFLSLLKTFQNIDRLNKGAISKEEFRAAVETRFGLEISEPQFEQLLDRLPLDRHGNVQYPIFMAAFDTRKGAPSLFQVAAQPSLNHNLAKEKGSEDDHRDLQLFSLVKSLVANRYKDVLQVFEELDEKNTRRLTQEDMYQLLKRLVPHQEVTRGEVRRLWSSLFTQQDGTVDFQQFLRHFGPSPRSCCFPNAKRNPPKRGDNDFMRLSNRLSYVSDILVDALRAKVEMSVSELWTEFSEMDFSGTGFVSSDEFKEILMSLCVHLSQYECDVLARKFDINHDGCVSYLEFLRPFLSQSQIWKHGSNMAAALQTPRENQEIATPETLNRNIRKKLQRKAKALSKACTRLDSSSSGLLSAAELGAVLQLLGVCQSQEELKSVFSTLHTHPSGCLDYRPLLLDKHRSSSHSQQSKQSRSEA
ncbi:EF-hand calcium-binding domain-containing protein 6 isoform X2 [Danio rerio]|uniref:EF-hand calcium-binding domain-containing protein 6 isoform X2 n=1 Tax=Danio rerio TaxID=7955 RepID=A0A8M2BFP3_DANRE|nr:EF-hand calcium-binding domain-containing protein 6 isoform X2 [Danio rerio]|eukprot:XP_005168423.1 EF-hand calcium-binding domain-containing protein 6 isoform X2 [Danio rerio]